MKLKNTKTLRLYDKNSMNNKNEFKHQCLYSTAIIIKGKSGSKTQTELSKPTHRFLYLLFFEKYFNNSCHTSFKMKKKKK